MHTSVNFDVCLLQLTEEIPLYCNHWILKTEYNQSIMKTLNLNDITIVAKKHGIIIVFKDAVTLYYFIQVDSNVHSYNRTW